MAVHTIIAFFVAMGVPTAITALCSWALQRRIMRREKKAEELERNRERLDVMLLQSTTAAIALGGGYSQGGAADPGCALQRGYAQGFGICSPSKASTKGFFDFAGRPRPA